MRRKFALLTLAVTIIAGVFLFGCSKKNPTQPGDTAPTAPTLSQPVNGATGVLTNSTLFWHGSSGAISYRLQVATDSIFSNLVYDQGGLTDTNQTVGLIAERLYYWRVNASNNAGISDWSSFWSFTTAGCGIEWITIPAGSFKMGQAPNDPYGWYGNENPLHSVYLDAYQISKYEVTNAQFQAFINASGYSNNTYWTAEGWDWRTANNINEPAYWSSGQYNSGPSFPNYPVVGVSWYEAYAFCKWAGGRLPTEAEWEKAARGTDSSYIWPWGSVWDGSKCNSYYNTAPDTFTYSSPVGFFSTGQSPYGVYDMAGNVVEWVNDWYQNNYYSISPTNNPQGPEIGSDRVLRGGSWYWVDVHCRVSYRVWYAPHDRKYYLGFRLAR